LEQLGTIKTIRKASKGFWIGLEGFIGKAKGKAQLEGQMEVIRRLLIGLVEVSN